MNFDNAKFLWLLLLIPFLFCFLLKSWKIFHNFEKSKVFLVFDSKHKPSWFLRLFAGFIKLIAFTTIIIALAEPYYHYHTNEAKYENVRIYFLVDVSRSMVHARDILPNRLEAAKKEILIIYEELAGIEASIIPFAGEPNPYYCPLTWNRTAFLGMLRELSPDCAPSLGTNLLLAVESLKTIKTKPGTNLVVLLSDGGKEETVNRVKLINEVSKLLFNFYCVGIGSDYPAPLLIDGKIEYSQLDEDVLKNIASVGKGKYVNFREKNLLYDFLKQTISVSKVPSKESVVVCKKIELQYYFYVLGAFLIWMGFMLNRSR